MAGLFISGLVIIRKSISEWRNYSKTKSHTIGSMYDQNCRLTVQPLEVMLKNDMKLNLERNNQNEENTKN